MGARHPLRQTKTETEKIDSCSGWLHTAVHSMQHTQCRALSASGDRCTRRVNKNSGDGLCGTHMRGTPHGTITPSSGGDQQSRIEVRVHDIRGINFYIDDHNNVYDPRDIVGRKPRPRVIAQWQADSAGCIGIASLGLEPAPETDSTSEIESV